MKTLKISLISICALLLMGAFTLAVLDHYEVSKDFSIEFKSKDPSGSFKIMEGNIDFDEKDIASSNFDFKIDVRSISTGNGMMTKKAQTPEWFDSAK